MIKYIDGEYEIYKKGQPENTCLTSNIGFDKGDKVIHDDKYYSSSGCGTRSWAADIDNMSDSEHYLHVTCVMKNIINKHYFFTGSIISMRICNCNISLHQTVLFLMKFFLFEYIYIKMRSVGI